MYSSQGGSTGASWELYAKARGIAWYMSLRPLVRRMQSTAGRARGTRGGVRGVDIRGRTAGSHVRLC